ncbi:helix-turn-helix domain-containing protein [uncultured Psychroserpens sp.]|uniref:AlbA family DNA-binding domain-containing protein n=1 Tax=uncultured Psychroserpens sp. TaxID=255436 RepID=UPI0026139294|nr:ATP-binding protein [uncultured Psychroserpens sp.]
MTEYNLEYLNALIENKVEENLNLDYKAAGSLNRQNNKTTEISKDVSALANSDGGILIYGIKEDSVNKHLPEKFDPINRKEFSKEWLEQIIQDKIRPRISDFKIYTIEIDNDQVVYIVDVKKSNTAHQAFDKKYYKRFNFQSTAMYDYEIRDILNRDKNPSIELEFEFKNSRESLIIYALNIGSVYAKYVNVKIRLPKKITNYHYYERIIDNKIIEIFLDNSKKDILSVDRGFGNTMRNQYGTPRYIPILPTQRFKLVELGLINYPFDFEHEIEWEVYCDNALPKYGSKKTKELLNK